MTSPTDEELFNLAFAAIPKPDDFGAGNWAKNRERINQREGFVLGYRAAEAANLALQLEILELKESLTYCRELQKTARDNWLRLEAEKENQDQWREIDPEARPPVGTDVLCLWSVFGDVQPDCTLGSWRGDHWWDGESRRRAPIAWRYIELPEGPK